MASKQRKRRRKRRAVKKAPPLPPVSAQAEEEKARTRGRRSAKGWRACLFGIGLLCALWTALAGFPCRLRCCAASWKASSRRPSTPPSPSNPFRSTRLPSALPCAASVSPTLKRRERRRRVADHRTAGHPATPPAFRGRPPPFRPPSAYTIRYSTSPISAMGCFPSQNCCPRRAGPTPPLMPRFSP